MTTNSKLDSYFSNHYDEKQLVDRYRISFETMWLTFILIFIGGFIKIFYGPWAAANTEMAFLVFIPLTYFVIRSVLKGAYFSVQKKSHTWSLILIVFIGVINLGNFAIQIISGGSIIEDGMLSETLFPLFVAIPFLLVPIVYFIQTKMSKNDEEEDE